MITIDDYGENKKLAKAIRKSMDKQPRSKAGLGYAPAMKQLLVDSFYTSLKRKNKYNVADKEERESNEGTFDSKRELNRWNELLLMQRAGDINDLKRQVPFLLQEAFISKQSGVGEIQEIKYIADFVYFSNKLQRLTIEDAKGFKTPEYKLKRKMMLYRYGDYVFLEV